MLKLGGINHNYLLERLFKKDESLLKKLEELYGFDNVYLYTNSEVINNIVKYDGGNVLNYQLSKDLIPLSQNINFNERMEEELAKLNLEEKKINVLRMRTICNSEKIYGYSGIK